MWDTRPRVSGSCAAEAAALHFHDLLGKLQAHVQLLENQPGGKASALKSSKFKGYSRVRTVHQIRPVAGEDARPMKFS